MGILGGISAGLSAGMRGFVAACQVPVVIILLAGIVFILVWLGAMIAEHFTEHRHFQVFLPKLADALKASTSSEQSAEIVKESGLLLRQKQYLIELTRHPELTVAMRESLAVHLEYLERRRYDRIVKVTDVVARVAPLVGLLGTLIPLGPGILALSAGDVETLSASLITAFDTTSLGLMIAGIAVIISAIRKRWYKDYMSAFDAIMECLLETEKLAGEGTGTGVGERAGVVGERTAAGERAGAKAPAAASASAPASESEARK